jgi:hypothetical protein
MVVPRKARISVVKFQEVCILTAGLFVQGCLTLGPIENSRKFAMNHGVIFAFPAKPYPQDSEINPLNHWLGRYSGRTI